MDASRDLGPPVGLTPCLWDEATCDVHCGRWARGKGRPRRAKKNNLLEKPVHQNPRFMQTRRSPRARHPHARSILAASCNTVHDCNHDCARHLSLLSVLTRTHFCKSYCLPCESALPSCYRRRRRSARISSYIWSACSTSGTLLRSVARREQRCHPLRAAPLARRTRCHRLQAVRP